MPQEIGQIIDLSHIAAGIVGGLTVILAGHFLTKDRENQRVRDDRKHAAEIAKEIRKREFISFLKSWRSEIANFQMRHGNIAVDVLRTTYTPKLPLFHAAVAKIEGDFADVATFQGLVNCVASLNSKELDNDKPRKFALEAIDALLKFAEKT